MVTHQYPTTDNTTERALRRRTGRRRRRVRLGALGLLAIVPGVLAANALATRNTVVPGVTVAGVDVGGLTRTEARGRLIHELGDRLAAPISLTLQGESARVVPAELGISIDVDATVSRALAAGRLEGRLLPYVWSTSIDPVMTLPARLRLPDRLAAVERRPRDARPVVGDGGAIRVQPAADGLTVDARATLAAIGETAVARDNVLALTPTVTHPAISTAVAETTADAARALIASPIAVTHAGRRIGRLTGRELAPLIRVHRQGGAYALALSPRGLEAALADDTRSIARAARNATWHVRGRRAHVVPAVAGRDVDGARTAAAVLAAAAAPDRSAAVVMGRREADITTREARAYGIRELVSSVTTDLGSSSPNRVFNVALMARFLDGQVIKPGGTFSFNERVGPRTPERGFKEGQAIVGGLLLPSIGGGVCQVATTVFGAAFYAGFPITQRLNHAWYISHYPIGMDATVSDGGPDLVFRNDSRYGVLIKASSTASTMTVGFYSTSRGYDVSKTVGPQQSFEEPKPRYILNPAFKGAEKIARTTGSRGFTITVGRVVRHNGKIVRSDSFSSHYIAESLLFAVGPAFVPKDGGPVEKAPPEFKF
jgi:vancomycin resistance protein YoaR